MSAGPANPMEQGMNFTVHEASIGSRSQAGHPTVQLCDVSKRFGAFEAVKQTSLTLGQGEVLTLLGPSGSGKTTLLMMIAGFLRPTAGRILLDGRDITNEPPQKRGIGVVFQSYALFPHLSVFRNVAFPLEARGMRGEDVARRVRDALDLVRLVEFSERYPSEISGGQQQRVALARSLVFEPNLLLLDEPLSALDKNLREHMQLELLRIKERLGVSMILVTHDQQEALAVSDRIVVMNQGSIQQTGKPEELYRRPANRFVAGFVGEVNIVSGIVRSVGKTTIVETPWGKVSALGPETIAVGDKVFVTVRPESIQFSRSGSGGGHLGAVVEQAVFGGEASKYILRLDSQETLVAKIQHDGGSPEPRPGEQVELSWDPEKTWIISAR